MTLNGTAKQYAFFSFLDWSGEKRSSVIPFLCAWLFGKRNILDGNGLVES